MSTLTHKQAEIFDFIQSYARSAGYPPTVREIGRQFGIRSPNGVMCHLKALEKKKRITRVEGRSRAITLVEPLCCPHCGKSPAEPVEAVGVADE